MTECPKCGGPLWDNREGIANGTLNPKSPLYKCKDKDCGHVIWPAKPKPKPAPKATGPGLPAERGPKWTWPQLSETYYQALLIARKQVVALATAQKLEVRMEDILSAAATVFIAASRDGVKPIVKEPEPEPEPADVY